MEIRIIQETNSVFTIGITDPNASLSSDTVEAIARENFKKIHSKEIKEIFSIHVSPFKRYAEISVCG